MATKSGAYGANDTAVAEPSGAYSASDKPADAPPAGKLRRAADTGLALGRGIVAVPETAVGISDLITGGRTGKAVERLGVRFKDAKQVLTDFQSDEQKAADARVQQADGFLPTVGAMIENPSTIANAVAESAPSMLAGGAVSRGLVNKGVNGITAGAVGEGVVSAGQAAEQVRQEGPTGFLTPKQAALAATSGAATGVINRASGKLADKLGIADVNTTMATGKLGGGTERGVLRRTAYGAVNEGVLQELPQSMQEQALQNLALDKPVGEGVAEAGAAGMLVGGLTGGGFGALTPPSKQNSVQPGAALNEQGGGNGVSNSPVKPPSIGSTEIESSGQSAATVVGGQAAPTKSVLDVGLVRPEGGGNHSKPEAGLAQGDGLGKRPGELASGGLDGGSAGLSQGSSPSLNTQNSIVKPPVDKAAAIGINRNEGPLSAGAAIAVDTGADVITQTQEVEKQKAEAAAKEKAKPGADGKKPEPEAPAPVQPAPADPTAPITGPFTEAIHGGAANVTPTPAPAVDPQGPATPEGVGAQPDAPAAPGVGADQGPQGESVVPAAVPEPVAAPVTPPPTQESTNATQQAIQGETIDPETGEIIQLGAQGAGGDGGQRPEDALQPGADAKGPQPAPDQPAAPAAASTPPEGKPAAPTEPVDLGAHTAATSPHNDRPEPTQAQKEAGNAKLGHVVMNGVGLSIENPEGSTRKSKPGSPVKWETTMKGGHYGYVKGSIGMDGDHVDTFIKPGTPLDFSGTVFVVDQVDPATGKPDEHKVMIGYQNGMAARQAYQGNYQPGWKGLKAITPMTWDEFKRWVKSEGTKAPLAAGKPALDAPATTPQSAPTSAPSPDTTSSAAAPVGPVPAPTQAVAPSKTESVSPAATGPSQDGTQAATKSNTLRVGTMPTNAEPVTIKDGVIYIGKYEALNFDTGEPVRIAPDANPLQIRKVLADNKALGAHQKVFGGAASVPDAKADSQTFVPAPDGSLDYGAITPEMGKAMRRQAGKIRLQEGNALFGMRHIEERHGAQIRDAGFTSVQEFVADIAHNIQQIWKPSETTQLVAVRAAGNDRIMYIELRPAKDAAGDFYTVRTAFPARAAFVQNKDGWKKLWEGRAQPSPPAASEQAPFAVPPQTADKAATIPSGQSGAIVSPATASAKPTGGRTLRSAAYERNPLLTFLAKHGLFHDSEKPRSQKAEFSPDKQIMVMGYGPVFKKTGLMPDLLVARAVEDGYLPRDGTESQLVDLIRRAIGGEKIVPMYAEGVAEMQKRVQAIDDLRELNDNQRDGIPDDIFGTPSNTSTEDAMRALGFTEQEIHDATAQGPRKPQEGSQGSSEPDEAQATGPGEGAQGGPRAPPDEAKPEGLTAPTADGATRVIRQTIVKRTPGRREESSPWKRFATGEYIVSVQQFENGQATALHVVRKIGDVVSIEAAPSEMLETGDFGYLRDAALALFEQDQLGLTAPTRADVLRQQERTDNVEALDNREQIDREAGAQTLTAQTAPEQRRDTTGDIFGGPSPEEAMAAKARDDEAKAKKKAAEDAASGQAGMFDQREASAPVTPAEQSKPKDRLTDAGEELIRNRRGKLKGLAWDDVSAMNDTLKVAQVIKSNVWPRPDYAKMVEDGAPAWKAASLKAVYDKLAAAPVTRTAPTDADLRAYIETMNQVRETLMAELDRVERDGTGDKLWASLEKANVFGKVFPIPTDAKPVFGYPSAFDRVSAQGKENNRRALLIGGNAAVQALQFNYKMTSKVKDLLAEGFPKKQEAWEKSYEVRQTETRDNDVPEGERTGEPQHRFYVYEKGSRWRLAKGVQDGGYATQEQAETFARTLTAKKRDVLPPSRGLDLADVSRTGPDWRKGQNVTTDQVMEHFGFRGVNLGEYVKAKQEIAQAHLNHAFDAFNDLADLLGVPPKAMSLNGTLGVAIGAQGSGKALAHFVPGVNEINITRDSGAGALAHEFGHAVDHYFATQHGRAVSMAKRPYLSAAVDKTQDAGNVRPEVMDAMRTVMKAINTRPMTEAEAKKYMADQRALNERRMDRWVTEFKGNRGADPEALAAVAEKLKRGDVGEVRDDDVESNLAEFMRAAGLKPGNSLAANAFTTAYRLRDLADEARFMASHIPQLETNYSKVSAAMDAKKTGDGYWGTPWEKFARAFETFVMDALNDRQRESLYLSGLVDGKGWQTWADATGKSAPYPSGDERLVMQQAFQKLVDTIQTREDDAGNVAMFARGTKRTTGVHMDDAEAIIAQAREALPTAPPIIPLESLAQAPADLRKFIKAAGAEADFEAAYHMGKIYVLPSNVGSTTRLQFLLTNHEIIHHGLRTMLGPRMNQVMFQIHATNANVRAAAAEQVRKGYATSKVLATEEALADMPVEDLVKLNGWDKIVAAVREWLRGAAMRLRRVGLGNVADAIDAKEWTDKDVAYLIAQAKGISRGGSAKYATEGTVFGLDNVTEFNSDGPAKEFERYKRLVDQVGQEYTAKGSAMTFEEFTAKVKPLQDKMWEAHFKLERWKAGRPATSTEEVFPGFQEIPIGTRILATHGMKYPEPTMGTVVGRRGLRVGEKAYVLPEVDFGDGEGRAVLPGDIKEVFAGPHTLFARGGLDGVTDKINTTTKTASNAAAHYRGLGLQALGRRQITEIYGGILPQLPTYNTLMAQMDADKNEAGAEADQIAQDWGKLKDERQLAELMHDATLSQMDPERPLLRGDDPLTYDRLRDQFVALSPEARKVYVDARETYRTHHENVRQAIRDRIERSELRGQRKAELLQQMDDEFYKAIKGVYFPLARFGDYVVIVRDGTGKAVSVNRAETINEAEALQRSLRQAYPDMTVGKVLKSKEFNAGRDAVGRGFMQNLYEVLGKQDMDEMQRAEMEDMLGQLYLSALPDLSWAKHGIHRKGTPGFSQDARRAFAQNTFHGARYLAKVRYSDLLENELSDAQKQVDGMNDSESFDSVKAQQVIDEMVKRHDAAMNPAGNSLSTALTSLGFVFHLGLSPASAVVNLTQTALVAYPIMGAKWGFDKAAAALLKASQQAAANKNDISAALSPDEKRAYDEAVRSGVIDVTMAHDLAGISQGEDAKVSWKLRPVMRWASFLFHHAEKFNRQATFVAAYRLAREAGSNPVQAYDQAVKATYDGHFDYSNTNRPRIMQGNAAKVILLFKQYGQNMVYTLARQAYLSMKGKNQFERAQARKALGGLLAMHAAAAGVLGLPMVSTLLAAASMLGGDDDEPWDAEVALRNMLADALGDQAADVLARGLSRLTPWDISGRVGLDKLILPDIQEGLEGQRLGESAMAAALGPVAGIGVALLKGLQEVSDGNWARGLEAMAPSLLRGPARAVRYASEGAIDKTGKPIVEDVNSFGIVGQALGFSPSDVRLATEAKSAVHQADARLAKRRATLMRHYAMAMIAGDEEGAADVREDILAFNERNPQRRINPLQMARSVATRRKQIAESKGGVYLPKTHRDAMEAGQFGMP